MIFYLLVLTEFCVTQLVYCFPLSDYHLFILRLLSHTREKLLGEWEYEILICSEVIM